MAADQMTDAELLAELGRYQALIVHCSRPGKGDEGIGGLLFPEDMRRAIEIGASPARELCCSVVWPQHTEAFGAIGIILKPRSTASIASICSTDGGTSYDPATGKREGMGLPFSAQRVLETFANATSYNEWNVRYAETIGIFVHPTEPPEVAQRVRLSDLPGYDPAMQDEEVVSAVAINGAQIRAALPGLPIYSFSGTGIIRLDGSGPVPIDAAELYG